MRKEESIDLMKLYASCDTKRWNLFLNRCLNTHDLKLLARVRYQLQAGMADLAKKKLNSEKMILWFIRLQNSIELTAKKIIKQKDPNSCDDPLRANIKHKARKTARDHELELFFKRTGY